MNIASIKSLCFIIDEQQTNSSGEHSERENEKISECTKSLIDELQVKTNTAAAKTMNGQYHIYSDEFSDETCRDRKGMLFIYIYLISFFGLLKQLA